MRKILILIFAIILLFITYDFYSNSQITDKKEDTKDISYRVTESNNLIEETDEVASTEEELTTYISTVNNEVDEVLTKEELTEDDKLTLTNTFITLTDFIFYNGTIKGKTFNELTTSAKESVITLYEKIDSKIEEKFPGYKEQIKETSTKTYNNIKDKLTTLKDDLLTSYRQEIGEDNFNDQQELFDESISTMKDSFSPVIDTIVEKSKEIYEEATTKADSWYQEWKEENAQ